MRSPFNSMDVIDNTEGNSVLPGPTRVLGYGRKDGHEIVWLIELPRASKVKATQRKAYASGPFHRNLSELLHALAEIHIHVLKLKADPKLLMTDQDRLSTCVNDRQRKRLLKDLKDRDFRYEAIWPLVRDATSNALRPLGAVLEDTELPSRIVTRAAETKTSKPTLYNWLHRYLAGGCQRNAVLSNYDRCGNPGQPKAQNNKLGRHTRLYKKGLVSSKGYALSEKDKDRLAWGYRLISHAMRPRDAYLVTCATHWAHHEVDDLGKTRSRLFDKTLRPTFAQFKRWGEKLSEKSITEMLLGPNRWRQQTASKGGSEQDSIAAVGQQAMFDGTSSDVYLVSYRSRLKKLPPMTRLILKESRVGLIYGFYCGWEPASPKTALMAILHGAMPCKVVWGERFGVTIPKGAIPGLIARTHLTDNGELKAAEMTEAERQFGIGLECTQTMSGDRKGGVETQHHSDHAHLDKRLPGATHGRSRRRGEDHPALGALFNYYEYMAELIRYVVWHNTVQEVPHLAPDDMLFADPPIKPTRINIYNWLTDRHMNVSLPVNYEALRAFTLPDVDAVIRKNGIYLEANIHGRKTLLARLRYTSPELAATGLLSQVKQTGTPIHVRLKMDRSNLSEAWLPTKGGMIRVTTSPRDKTILTKLTLDEWILYLEDEVIRTDLAAGAKEQADAETVMRRLDIAAKATAEANAELEKLPKPPSKKDLVSNLERNRAEELAYLQAQDDSQLPSNDSPQALAPGMHTEDEEPSAAEAAMNAYHAQAEAA